MTDWHKYAATYIERLRGPDSENAYHTLIEADDAIIPILIDAYRAEQDSEIRSDLVEVIWQHRLPDTIGFLAEAVDDPAPEVWKSALDGLVAIGGKLAIQVLESAKQRLGFGSQKERTKVEWIDEAIQQTVEKLKQNMAEKIAIYEKAEREIQKDRLWKAKEILQGNLKRLGYDKKLYEMYGNLLDRLGDRMEAGRYLFLSGQIQAADSESVSLYLKRHTKKDPRYLLRTFPKAAQLKKIEAYPESVAKVLKELGLKDKDLYLKLPKPAEHKGTWFDNIVSYIIQIIILAVCLIVGFFVIMGWIVF